MSAPPRCRREAVILQLGVELPNQRAHMLLRATLRLGEAVKLMHQPFGVHPAERVPADGKRPGIVTYDDTLAQKIVRMDAAPQRTPCFRRGRLLVAIWTGSGVTVNAVMPS